MMYRHTKITIEQAQRNQPWTVPYSAGIDIASKELAPHILASHTVLHAMKSLGKLASVFEALDHSRYTGVSGKSETITEDQLKLVEDMAADLFTAAMRFANLYDFSLALKLCERVTEKNGVAIPGSLEEFEE